MKRLRITKLGRISFQGLVISLVVISQYAAPNWRDTTSGKRVSVRHSHRKRFPHIKWVVHNFPVFEEAETLCQESSTHDYSFGLNQPIYRPELKWRQDGHRRIYGIKTEFWRNNSITCSSIVKRLGIPKLGRISLQDVGINLVVISQYAALNWRETTSVNMGSVKRWPRTRFPRIRWLVHKFPVIEEAETLCQESPTND